jgi:hypothetical protein
LERNPHSFIFYLKPWSPKLISVLKQPQGELLQLEVVHDMVSKP